MTFQLGRSHWIPINILKHIFLRNHLANGTQILNEDPSGWENENLYKLLWSHEQGGRHIHIW